MIHIESKLIKSEDKAEKVSGASAIVLGMLTFLGLGILCLLVDIIIIFLAVTLKNHCFC